MVLATHRAEGGGSVIYNIGNEVCHLRDFRLTWGTTSLPYLETFILILESTHRFNREGENKPKSEKKEMGERSEPEFFSNSLNCNRFNHIDEGKLASIMVNTKKR